jgi:hypothetical protein
MNKIKIKEHPIKCPAGYNFNVLSWRCRMCPSFCKYDKNNSVLHCWKTPPAMPAACRVINEKTYKCKRCNKHQKKQDMQQDTHVPGWIEELNCNTCGAALFENDIETNNVEPAE